MASNDQLSYKAGEAKGQTQEKVGHGVDAAKCNTEGAKENTGNFFTHTKDKVSEAAQATKDKVTGAGTDAKDKSCETTQAAKDKSCETTQAAKDKVSGN